MNKNQNQEPEQKSIKDIINQYKESNDENITKTASIPDAKTYNPDQYNNIMQKETDPDLLTSYEIIKLPSKGLFYDNKIKEVEVEYMTSRDEDLLTTPSLIESGKILDLLLKRKIKTKNVDVEKLLPGDRNAILLFLRSSSYGFDYHVEVIDPRTGKPFKTIIDLSKLQYKDVKELPDENGLFSVNLKMRKKLVKFRLLSAGEDNKIFKVAEEIKEAYNTDFSDYNTRKLQSSVVSIDGNTDRSYINRFIEAMPALDALIIRRKILEVSPDVDMTYEFEAKDGFKFKGRLTLGVDFFFPEN